MNKLKHLLLLALPIMVFAQTTPQPNLQNQFVADGLPANDVAVIKAYAKQPQFSDYYDNAAQQIGEVKYVETLNSELQNLKVSKIFIATSCAAKAANIATLVEAKQECYIYGTANNIQYRERINMQRILAVTCADSQSCSEPHSGKLRQPDLENVLAIMVEYRNKCSTLECKRDIELINYAGNSFYRNQISNMQVKFIDTSPKVSNKKLLEIALQTYKKSPSNSYVMGQDVALRCNLQVIAGAARSLKTCLQGAVLMSSVYGVRYDYADYGAGVADSVTVIKLAQPNAAQTQLLIGAVEGGLGFDF